MTVSKQENQGIKKSGQQIELEKVLENLELAKSSKINDTNKHAFINKLIDVVKEKNCGYERYFQKLTNQFISIFGIEFYRTFILGVFSVFEIDYLFKPKENKESKKNKESKENKNKSHLFTDFVDKKQPEAKQKPKDNAIITEKQPLEKSDSAPKQNKKIE